MLKDIDTIDPNSGRLLKENGEFLNIADLFQEALDPLLGFAVYSEKQRAIHKGESFGVSMYATGLANNGVVTMIGRVGAKQIHFDGMDIDLSSGGVLLELIEAPTVTVLGTLTSAHRKNRAIGTPTSNTMLIYDGATITGGSVVYSTKPPVISIGGNKVSSANASIADGWVLKQNTDYAIRITNQSGAAIDYSASFGWHESSIVLV